MFDRIKSFWRGVKSMFTLTDIKRIVGGDAALSRTMIENIELWRSMLSGEAPWVNDIVESVSYTHLDVYKRQSRHSFRR